MTDADRRPAERDPDEQVAAVGAMLFVAVEPVPVAVLSAQLGCSEAEARAAVARLADHAGALGLMVEWSGADAVQLVTAPRLAPVIRRFRGLERPARLSRAALETLAVVAYRQPVTRQEIERIRGVDSGAVLQTLLARDLVEPVGRRETPGRPTTYGTTVTFLRVFGLSSLDELPDAADELRRIDQQLGEDEPSRP